MDITTSPFAHLAPGVLPSAGWAATPGAQEPAQDAAAWFQGDAGGARITLSTALPHATDVAALAQRVLVHLTA